jgi:hypothetical protein
MADASLQARHPAQWPYSRNSRLRTGRQFLIGRQSPVFQSSTEILNLKFQILNLKSLTTLPRRHHRHRLPKILRR